MIYISVHKNDHLFLMFRKIKSKSYKVNFIPSKLLNNATIKNSSN